MSEEGIPAVNGSDWDFSPAPSLPSRRVVPVIGYPGPLFAAIHLSALVVLSLSTIVSVALFFFLCGCQCGGGSRPTPSSKKYSAGGTTVKGREGKTGKQGRDDDGRIPGGNRKEVSYDPSSASTGAAIGKRDPGTTASKGTRAASSGEGGQHHQQQQQQQHIRNFWKWNVGERFVLYLGTCDIGLGISHFFDHAYMYYAKENPPDLLCAFFAFFLHEFSVAQWFVVLLSAGSACSLVVFGKKFSLGRWDWKVFVFAFAVPFVVGAFGIKYEMLGASGAWCYMNLATDAGIHYYQVFTVFQVALYGVVALAYGAIWFKIQRTARLMKGSSTGRYQNSARVMLIFVGVFIFQWWSLTLFNVWVLLFTQPPAPVLVLAVILINLGGVYNCLAYTIVRRRLQSQAKQANRVVVSGGGAAPGETGARSGPPAAAAAASSVVGGELGGAYSSASDNGSQSSKSPLVEMHI